MLIHDQIRTVICSYQKLFLDKKDIEKARCPKDKLLPSVDLALSHVFCMLDDVERLVMENKIGEALNLLGFVQGILFHNRLYTLEEIAMRNKMSGVTEDKK